MVVEGTEKEEIEQSPMTQQPPPVQPGPKPATAPVEYNRPNFLAVGPAGATGYYLTAKPMAGGEIRYHFYSEWPIFFGLKGATMQTVEEPTFADLSFSPLFGVYTGITD